VALNQMTEHFNDAFEVYFPKQGRVVRTAHRAAGFLVTNAFRFRNRLFRGELLVNERIVEYPVVFKWIKERGRVLDIGCVSSRLPLQLASLGYAVHGLDTRPYPFTHPNFRFYQADLFRWTPDVKYDSIVLVSVVEHFGLGQYGDCVMPDADRHAVQTMAAWINHGGQLLVSVPFGQPAITPKHRVYDIHRLRDVFDGFTWMRDRYFVRRGRDWMPAERAEVEDVSSPRLPVNGVAILDLRLP
jgi:2-polyprenyl-3-methyl-5-hydroxy-6-metoxy-1,4-benzoquinol methylase